MLRESSVGHDSSPMGFLGNPDVQFGLDSGEFQPKNNIRKQKRQNKQQNNTQPKANMRYNADPFGLRMRKLAQCVVSPETLNEETRQSGDS